MATCYFCMNRATHKREVIIGHNTGSRIYVSRRGISGLSAGGGTRTGIRGVCDTCAREMEEAKDRELVVWAVLLSVAAIIIVFYMAYTNYYPTHRQYSDTTVTPDPKPPIVWEDKDIPK